MTTPQTDAEWLDLLRALHPGGPEPEIINAPDRAARSTPGLTAVTVAHERPPGAEQEGAKADPPPPSGVVALLAGDFATEVAAIWAGNSISAYLTASDRQRHVWYCWLAAPQSGSARLADFGPARLRDYLTRCKARDLLRAAYGVFAPGLVVALSKCGTQARQREFYPALVQALARQDLGAKHIRHRPDLTDIMVMSIAALPSALQSKPLFAKLCEDRGDDEYFAQACWTLKRLADLGLPDETQRVLRHDEPMVALSEAVAKLPFPEPPWPGTEHLRPLISVDALRNAGAQLKNCLTERADDYAIKVVTGEKYYYEWTGEAPAIVTVGCIRPLGWVVEEGHGLDNDPISAAIWVRIEADLSSWPNLAPLWISQSGRVHGAGFFERRLF